MKVPIAALPLRRIQLIQPPTSLARRLRVGLLLHGLFLFLLPWNGAFAQSFVALDFGKLRAYAKNNDELREVLDDLASRKRPPLYIVLPPPPLGESPETNGDPESGAEHSSWRDAWTSSVLAIYKDEPTFSSIPGATALFIQDISNDDEVVAALNRIVRRPPPELFDGDLVVLNPDDLADLRKIVRINKGESSSSQIQQFRAVQNFATKAWDQKDLILAPLHSAQVTLVTGIKRGGRGMTVIHCFPNTVGPMTAIDVGPDMQEVVRELIDVLRGSLVPISVQMGIEGIAYPLSNLELEAISAGLALILRREKNVVMYEQVIERRVDNETGRVTLLSFMPKSILRGGALSVSLRSERFMFLDWASRKRVRDFPIDTSGWSGGVGEKIGQNGEPVTKNRFHVVEAFNGGGSYNDFRSYLVPREIATHLGYSNCQESISGSAGDDLESQARNAAISGAHGGCREALEYLGAIVREIRIARELAGGGVKVQVILDEPRTRSMKLSLRRKRQAAEVIGDYLRTRAVDLGVEESAVHRLIHVGQPSPSEAKIEIRVAE